MSQDQSAIVRDDGRTRFSDFWKKEDYWAIWLGFAILIIGYFLYIASIPDSFRETVAKSNAIMQQETLKTGGELKTIEWYNAQSAVSRLNTRGSDVGKLVSKFLATPAGWKSNPLDSFYVSKEASETVNAANRAGADKAKATAAASLESARAAQDAAAAAGYQDAELNQEAQKAIDQWRADNSKASSAASKAATSPLNRVGTLLVLFILFGLAFGIGIAAMGKSPLKFFVGFIFVYIVAVLSFMMGSQATMKYYGIGSEAWAIIIGMLIANTVGTPKFAKPALQTEFFIKTGLVLLGAEVLFDKIIAIGIPGIFVAWVVTPTVLILTFIFGQKVLKMESPTLNITISADMSVCGTSAAIATAAACRAKKEELTLALGLSLVFTAIMMIVLPMFIKAVGMPEVLGGAWIGGTVDSTGAVAAAGAFLGQKALYVAATIKMIQNVLIGVTAFGVALYWCYKVDRVPGERVSALEIWNRFPKFVLGFLLASILASMVSGSLGSELSTAAVNGGLVRGLTSPLRSWCFCLAFASIGLSTNFRELAHYFKGGKPLILYVCGQSFNLCLTLAMAYLMFYVVFPDITARI